MKLSLEERAVKIASRLTAAGAHVTPDLRVSPATAAAFLDVSEGTLRNWRSAGSGPRYLHAGRVWYALDDLIEWLDAGASDRTR